MLHDVLKWFDRRDPELSRWGGGRLGIEWSAVAVSVVLHGMLAADAGDGRVRGELRRAGRARGADRRHGVARPGAVHVPGPRPGRRAAGACSPRPARSRRTSRRWRSRSPRRAGPPPPPVDTGPGAHARADRTGHDRRPTRHRGRGADGRGCSARSVSIKGNGAEHVGGVEGAVDRIADEILRRLEKGRTLVVWAFDASGSLQAERQRLSKHIETVYTHIKQLDEEELASDGGLLTARRLLRPRPQGPDARAHRRPRRHHQRHRLRRARHHRRRVDVPDRPGDLAPLGAVSRRRGARLSPDDHRRDRRGGRRRAATSGRRSPRPTRPRPPSTCSARRRSSAGSRAT